MVRISKLTDYGIVLLTHMTRNGQTAPAGAEDLYTATDLSAALRIPLPTVRKLLKALSKGELLYSERGATGGYRLARPASDISVAEVISILEGPLALTECSALDHSCGLERQCPSRPGWQKINAVVLDALRGLTLAEMARQGQIQGQIHGQTRGQIHGQTHGRSQ